VNFIYVQAFRIVLGVAIHLFTGYSLTHLQVDCSWNLKGYTACVCD